MPALLKATKAITNRLPKVISPGLHATIGCVAAGAFFLAGTFFWKRNRPAAISALICGGSHTLVAMTTNYQGGFVRDIDFPKHAQISVGLAMFTAMLPKFMGFENEREARLFNVLAISMAAVTGLTDFIGIEETKQFHQTQKAA